MDSLGAINCVLGKSICKLLIIESLPFRETDIYEQTIII